MEFTVSKSRSGTRTESVAGCGREEDHHSDPVECAAGGCGRPDYADGHRSGAGHPLLLPGARQERRRGNGSGAQAARLRAAAAGWRREHEVPGEPLGQHHLRPLADAHRRHVAGELSGAAADAGAYRGDPGEDAGVDDRADDLCDFDGGVALHAERRAAAAAAGRADHGGDRRPSPGVCAGDRRTERHGRPAVSRAGSEEGDGGADQTGRRCRAGRQGDFRRRRQSPVLPDRATGC